jgi:hypothetical protein
MTHSSLKCELFCIHVFGYFLWFLFLLISTFFSLWSDKIHEIFTIFLHLFRFTLFLKISYILEKIPWATENNVFPMTVGWNSLLMSVKYIWCEVLLSSEVSVLIFCLCNVSIGERDILKLYTTTMLIFICVLMTSICFVKLALPTFAMHFL